MTEIKIKVADNGFIVTESVWEDTDEKGNKIIDEDTEVIEDEDNEKEALRRLLLLVAEKLGYMEDKYGNENLKITFDGKGRRYEDEQNPKIMNKEAKL